MKINRKVFAVGMLILFIIFAYIIIITEKKENDKIQEIDNKELVKVISDVENRNSFFAVKNIILAYIDSVVELNINKDDINSFEENYNYAIEEYIKEKNDIAKQKIFNQLGKKEKEEYDVTLDNIGIKTEKLRKGKYYINEMNYIQESEDISIYLVLGQYIIDSNNKEMNFIVAVDTKNMTYEIYDEKYYADHEYKNLQIGQEIQLNIKEIEPNEYNQFKFKNISDENVILEYIAMYKEYAEKDIEKAYEMIDEEYRNKRFQTLDKFKKYIEENYENIFDTGIEKYHVSKKNGYTQYVCIDGNNNYYIIKEKSIMNYTMLLDMYTINTEEFSKNYAQSSNQKKVAYNIEKFINSLEGKNYYYAYNVLSEEFRNNYFPKQKDFEEYINNKIFEDNIIEYGAYNKEDEINIYEILLRDINSTQENKLTIIMKLLENEEYVMSFTVE